MSPETKKLKGQVDDYIRDAGGDPSDPRIRSALDGKINEFNSWMGDKPDWVRVSNIGPVTTKGSLDN